MIGDNVNKMKKIKKLTKIMACSLIAVPVLALNPIGASAEWKQDSTGWWYAADDSYYTGWNQIDGNWYYFDQKGYMLNNTIKDGYFLNDNGSWSNGGAEVQAYINLLNDKNWQEENGIKDITENIIMDINQDGVYEMLLDNGKDMADLQVSIVSYNSGNIKVDNIPSNHGGYYGYIKDENVLCVSGAHQGLFYGAGYKLENDKWEQVYSWNSKQIDDNSYENCTLNDNAVSETEFKEFLNKIDKYYYTW